MIYLYYFLAGLAYCVVAALPFIVTKSTQLWLGAAVGIVANVCWTLISRSVIQQDIPIYGLIYDAMLTLVFFGVPFLFIDSDITTRQIVGIVVTFIGLVLIKA